ncbi:hypothetical protein EV586_102657 [Tumebacillus sp. BK434]|uniref:hypothetical protein n=1 Tax=Tumebacillus sp. BK434 TaxID=2512169 RepID=UPI00104907F4|nr:hypothetical protein [Tumebacillus sp. BK434]TCP58204.1 hypothetical protein EV586_102657 [Tumebacillus sp. BK434]
MSEPDKKADQAQEPQQQLGHISKGMSELLVADMFNKHGITPEHRRQMTAEQKQEILDLVQDLQRQVDAFMKQGLVEKNVQLEPKAPLPGRAFAEPSSSPAPTLSNEAAAPKRKRRMVLRKDKDK